MDDRKYKFLVGVLGQDGASALKKAGERSPELGGAIFPRAVIAWLNVAGREQFEGSLPGVEDSYLHFSKSEGTFSGEVAVNDEVYTFEKANMVHLGACVAIALGADHEQISPRLRDLDLQKLGKNIDTIVKARVAMAELKRIRTQPLEKMAIADIAPGREIKNGVFDYSHVLNPAHQKRYKIMLAHDPADNQVTAALIHNGSRVGMINATPILHRQADVGEPGDLYIEDSEIKEEHRGQGLGPSLMEAVMAHGLHHLGIKNVVGGHHSTMAHRAHQKLTARHGLDGYSPTYEEPKRPDAIVGAYDGRAGPYKYTLKEELPFGKAAKSPGGGQETPGPAAAPHAPAQPEAPQPAVAVQSGKGPTVSLRPKPPKLPAPKSADEQVQTGPGSTAAPKTKAPGIQLPGAPKPPVHITKSQSETPCSICGIPQFLSDGTMTGCYCFKEIVKDVILQKHADGGYNLWLDGLDEEATITLLEAFGGK